MTQLAGLVCSLQARGGDTLDLSIYDTIGRSLFTEGIRAKDILARVSGAKSVKLINVRINSGGGDVFEGLAIYNTLAAHPARKVVYVDGIAASMASVIAMVGNKIVMPANAMLMIHDARAAVGGGARDMRRTADLLEKVQANIAAIYAARSRQPLSSVVAAMAAETWMTAAEARTLGYADEVTPAVQLVAQWDLSTCSHVPDHVRREIKATPSVALRALYSPDNRWLIANWKRYTASALGKVYSADPDEQRGTIAAYLQAASTGVGIVDAAWKDRAESTRAEMERAGVPLMPSLNS